jgi:hypothetical protein
MKPKFTSIIALLVLVTAVGYGGYLLATRTAAPVKARDILSINKNKTDFTVPPAEDIKAVQRISQHLILISNPQLDQNKGVDLKLFGQHKIVSQYTYNNEPSEVDVEFPYLVTFTFISNDNKYCYINKRFYSLGAVMPDGGRISSIETERVLIVKNNISEWIPVQAKAAETEESQEKD